MKNADSFEAFMHRLSSIVDTDISLSPGEMSNFYKQVEKTSPTAKAVLDWMQHRLIQEGPLNDSARPLCMNGEARTELRRLEIQKKILEAELETHQIMQNALDKEYSEGSADYERLQEESSIYRNEIGSALASLSKRLERVLGEHFAKDIEDQVSNVLNVEAGLVDATFEYHRRVSLNASKMRFDKEKLTRDIQRSEKALIAALKRYNAAYEDYIKYEGALASLGQENDENLSLDGMREKCIETQGEIKVLRARLGGLVEKVARKESLGILYKDSSQKLERQAIALKELSQIADSLLHRHFAFRSIRNVGFGVNEKQLNVLSSFESILMTLKEQYFARNELDGTTKSIHSLPLSVRDPNLFQSEFELEKEVASVNCKQFISMSQEISEKVITLLRQVTHSADSYEKSHEIQLKMQSIDETIAATAKKLAALRSEIIDFAKSIQNQSKERLFLREFFIYYFTQYQLVLSELRKLERFRA